MSSLTKILPAVLAGLLLAAPAKSALEVGQPFPELRTFNLEGPLPDTTGKVTLIDFWASWCAPCKASFPAYSALQVELAPRGLVIVGVSVDKTAAPYDAFLRRLAPTFATVRDPAQALVVHASVPAMPTAYLLDRRGVVRSVHRGFHRNTMPALRAEIVRLLEEQP